MQFDKLTKKELQGNLEQFLKLTYPRKKIEREVDTRFGKLDFVIDEKYIIELKLAKNSTTFKATRKSLSSKITNR